MESEKLNQMWADVCNRVKQYYDAEIVSQINAMFPRLQPQGMSEDFLMLTADNDFIKRWIEMRYLDAIKRALLDLYHTPFTVVIEVDPTQAASAQPPVSTPASVEAPVRTDATRHPAAPASPIGANTPFPAASMQTQPAEAQSFVGMQAPAPTADAQQDWPMASDATTDFGHAAPGIIGDGRGANGFPAEGAPTAPQAAAAFGNGPDGNFYPALTFENYVIGDSNRMAYSMATMVAEQPGKTHLNPLFIYGKSGLGKTHLMRAIQNYVRINIPTLRTVYVDSSDLLSDYMEASAAHDKEKSSYKNFKTRYEEADVLLIDDVQTLQGKNQTLNIVFQIFNKLISMGKQVVLSADRAPNVIDIDERYKSRFNSGGTIDIQPPEVETKLGIVKTFIDEYRENEGKPDFSIAPDIQMYIAESSGSNIRELKSAVTKVIYQMTFFNQPQLTLTDVRALLENHFTGGVSKRLTVEDIQREVANYFKVSQSDLIGQKRTKNIAYARHVAIYLSRMLLDISFQAVGDKFNRDHSTVMSSVNKIEQTMQKERELQEEIEVLKKIIREL